MENLTGPQKKQLCLAKTLVKVLQPLKKQLTPREAEILQLCKQYSGYCQLWEKLKFSGPAVYHQTIFKLKKKYDLAEAMEKKAVKPPRYVQPAQPRISGKKTTLLLDAFKASGATFSPREALYINSLSEGLTGEEIAEKMGVTYSSFRVWKTRFLKAQGLTNVPKKIVRKETLRKRARAKVHTLPSVKIHATPRSTQFAAGTLTPLIARELKRLARL